MTSDRRTLVQFLASTALVAAACVAYLAAAGLADDDIRLLLRLTAQAAFVVLLLVFIARPLRDLIKTPLTLTLLKNRKQLGVTFAGIHTVHMALIFYSAQQISDFEFSLASNLPGMVTYVVIYLMLITSFSDPAKAIGPKAWRILHKTGLFLVTAVFAQTQLPRSMGDLAEANWALIGLLIFALLVRVTAFFDNRKKAGER
ncbi:MAG: ferric reductase-like transmembrane domain-containing protein [Woeseiaceae bacterium]|nr:ferric reductase-like transmembrane domain-containing protein [Woeseiaceae bacterium]MDX2607886.1 ferric reductase-like transmembrane domain-containing protein [Woeseiaceae bacterium]